MFSKRTIAYRICSICPLCKLFKKMRSLCPVCRLAKEKERIGQDFEERYPQRPLRVKEKRVEEGLRQRIEEGLYLLRKSPDRPPLMNYYEEIVGSSFRVDELKRAKDEGKRVIGTFCLFAPVELIDACGATSVRLCAGVYETISLAEQVLPRDICPLIKSSLGFKIAGLSFFELCDLVILPTTCDGKKKLGEILSWFLPVWIMDLPQRKDPKDLERVWLDEIKAFKRRLEDLTGVKITRKRLKESIQRFQRRQRVIRWLYELRKQNPPPISGQDSLLVAQAAFYDDVCRWTEKTEKLCEWLSQRKDSSSQDPLRLLLTGAPIIWPNYKIPAIIEGAGAVIVADEVCSGIQGLYEGVEVDEWAEESMLRAIATKYLLPVTCPCFIASDDRVDRILSLIEEFSVDGVVYHSLRLCQLYDIESYKTREVLREKGIPMLNIHTEYSQEDIEQIKTRVEAFFELIGERR
jgi:benzoyl-CoA reductase/2-hydroxyglutaryl-CoA dehydratase subunit BcrC/BadD/HgdB